MRTLLLLGVAAGSLLLAGRASAAELPMIDSPARIGLTAVAFGHAKEPMLDYGAPYGGDTRVYTGGPDRIPGEGDYRGTDYPPPAHDPYQDGYRGDADGYADDMEARERYWLEQSCRPTSRATGTIIGGLLGGFAGNRIAGRGDRTIGTILGGVVGAGVGNIIEQSADKQRCRAYLDEAQARHRSGSQGNGGYHHQGGGYAQGGHHQGGNYYQQGGPYHHGGATVYHQGMPGYGYGYGYGYYSPGVIVTTVITTGAPVITETIETTTTTSYVKAPARKRHAPKKRAYKPKPKPRCVC